MGQVFSMIPGFGADMMPKGQEAASQAKIKRMMTLMDCLTDAELDSPSEKIFTPQRMERVARGAGLHPLHVVELIEEYKRLAKMMGAMKGMKMPKKGGMSSHAQNLNVQQMARALPPQARCSPPPPLPPGTRHAKPTRVLEIAAATACALWRAASVPRLLASRPF